MNPRPCAKKIAYYTAQEAVNAAVEYQERHGNSKPNRHYKCPYCYKWHLTSKGNRQVKGIKAEKPNPTAEYWKHRLGVKDE